MELQEFMFVFQDFKEQLKQIPSLPLLLKSVEKTTKKLECLNLYSLVDRRQFDFELFQQQTFDEISNLVRDVNIITQKSQEQSVNMHLLHELEQRIDNIKEQKIQAFDKLSKMEESIQQNIDVLVDQSILYRPPQVDNQIKQVQQYEEEAAQEQTYQSEKDCDKIQRLKKEIDSINQKIVKINRGRGKWFDGDHKDFVKIYTRCRGQPTIIVEEGVKLLGMKNIEIIDHLEVYQNYLQLQKEKKLASQEYKNIKFIQQETQFEQKNHLQHIKMVKEKEKQRIKLEENITKKLQIQQFKKKKEQQKQKLIEQFQISRKNEKKNQRISVQKKKQIQLRNMKIIEERSQKFKLRNNTKGLNTTMNKQKLSSKLNRHQQSNYPKLEIPKHSLLIQNKKS